MQMITSVLSESSLPLQPCLMWHNTFKWVVNIDWPFFLNSLCSSDRISGSPPDRKNNVLPIRSINDRTVHDTQTHTHTTILLPFVWDYPCKPVPEETLLHAVFWVYDAGEDSKGRWTDNPAGCHPIQTNSAPTIIHIISMSDALPGAILPIYAGSGQVPSMLDCIPGGIQQTYILQPIGNVPME